VWPGNRTDAKSLKLTGLKSIYWVIFLFVRQLFSRKLSGLNKETRTLIEVFGMPENKIIPEVEAEKAI
jgi:hypothetical protein